MMNVRSSSYSSSSSYFSSSSTHAATESFLPDICRRHLPRDAVAQRLVEERPMVAPGENLHHRVTPQLLQRLLQEYRCPVEVESVFGSHVNMQLALKLGAQC